MAKNAGYIKTRRGLIRGGFRYLSGTAVKVFLDLWSYDGKLGCFPKIKTIAQDLDLSERAVKRAITELVDKRWIEIERGRVNTYKFTHLRDTIVP